MQILLIFQIVIISTLWYLYLHKKTRISLKFLYIDNVAVIVPSLILSIYLEGINQIHIILLIIINFILIFGLSFTFTMIRFWRTPKRKIIAKDGEIVSPADGNVLYIKKIEKGEVPISIKKGLEASIEEIAQTDLLNQGSWLVGINMTPFDVHKNCAPIDGEVILNKHINGEFLSLKEPKALIRNERNTLVLKTDDNEFFGIIQTSSKLVKRIDSYIKVGQKIKQGDWFGMIRFGSQVDVIIPGNYTVSLEIGQQTYAGKTIIAVK
jgi:phosphatidylserine decarboxylase